MKIEYYFLLYLLNKYKNSGGIKTIKIIPK